MSDTFLICHVWYRNFKFSYSVSEKLLCISSLGFQRQNLNCKTLLFHKEKHLFLPQSFLQLTHLNLTRPVENDHVDK